MVSQSLPKISVIMPVYNADPYLTLAIESILNQSLQAFEFIIINDGSTDNSETIIRQFAEMDARIKVISRENQGLVASLNEGLTMAQAPLIARMDADDISLPERFAREYAYLQSHPDVVCVGTASFIIDEEGDEINCLSVPCDNDEIQRLLLAGHCPIEHPSVMFNKAVALSVGGYRKEFEMAEDYDLWLRMGEIGLIRNIDTPLIRYRYLNTSISGKNQSTQHEMTRLACEEAWQRRGMEVDFTAGREWRPTNSSQSKYFFALKYGWWAFNYKNKSAAIKYAKRAIGLMPWKTTGWKLLIISILKLRTAK